MEISQWDIYRTESTASIEGIAGISRDANGGIGKKPLHWPDDWLFFTTIFRVTNGRSFAADQSASVDFSILCQNFSNLWEWNVCGGGAGRIFGISGIGGITR